MKTQDVRYVSQKRQVEQNKVDKLRATLHGLENQSNNKHTLFVDQKDDVENFPDAELKTRSSKRLRGAVGLASTDRAEEAATTAVLPKRLARRKDNAYKELMQRTERLAKLKQMESTMTMQKDLMGKGKTKGGSHSLLGRY